MEPVKLVVQHELQQRGKCLMSCKSLLLCTECRYSSLLSCKHKHKAIICLSVPGLTWRQIVTGLADDCSSLIGAAWPTLEPSAGCLVAGALRSAANNPHHHQPTRGQPISPHLPAIVVLPMGFLLDQKAAFETISQQHFLAKGRYGGSLLCRP